MKKIIFTLFVLLSSLYSSVTNEYPSQKILDSNIPIVDIRTVGEWKETGLLKGAIPIMFFNERGGYNVQVFLDTLNQKVDTKKPFAIICRTGSRTRMLAAFLSKDIGYSIVNLSGGMIYAQTKKLPIISYK